MTGVLFLAWGIPFLLHAQPVFSATNTVLSATNTNARTTASVIEESNVVSNEEPALPYAPALSAEEGDAFPHLRIISTLDRTVAHVGDVLHYTVAVRHASNTRVSSFEGGIYQTGYEIRDRVTGARTNKDGTVVTSNTFILAFYSITNYVIPPFFITFSNERAQGVLDTGHLDVVIRPLSGSAMLTNDIPDIKGPVAKGGLPLALLIALGITALSALIGFVVSRRRRQKDGKDVLLPEDEEAFVALRALREKGYLAEENYRSFYFELYEILKRYCARRFRVHVLEKPSKESLAIMERVNVPEHEKIRAFFETADMVKFAKARPEEGLPEAHITFVTEYVEKTRPRAVEDSPPSPEPQPAQVSSRPHEAPANAKVDENPRSAVQFERDAPAQAASTAKAQSRLRRETRKHARVPGGVRRVFRLTTPRGTPARRKELRHLMRLVKKAKAIRMRKGRAGLTVTRKRYPSS